jgi:Uma2 family endonuclease
MATAPEMLPHITHTGLTWDEYFSLPEDELRHAELIDGVVFVNPPSRPHQFIVGELFAAIREWVRAKPGRGEVTFEPLVRITERHGYQPDVAWYPEDRLPAGDGYWDAPPALVIEVLSPSTRVVDLNRKPADYARIGVEELWIVDPDLLTVRVHRRDRAGNLELFETRGVRGAMAGGDAPPEPFPLETPLMRGLAIPLRSLVR